MMVGTSVKHRKMEIYLTINKNVIIAEIETTQSIEKELKVLESKSGVTIDEYGRTILYFDHIKLLNDLIRVENEWKIVFEKAITKKSNMIIEGD